MKTIIEQLKNPFNEVEKHQWYKCPCCNGDLYTSRNSMMMVMDGNIVFHCENDKEHKFWVNAREIDDVLHQNKNATETNWDSEQDWELIDGEWKIIEDEEN